jgi:hypothetical protein
MTAEQTARTFLWGYSREHLPCCSHKCRAITHRSTFSFAKSKVVARTMASLLRFSYKLTSRPEFTNGGSRVQPSEKIRILVRHVKLAAEATTRSEYGQVHARHSASEPIQTTGVPIHIALDSIIYSEKYRIVPFMAWFSLLLFLTLAPNGILLGHSQRNRST